MRASEMISELTAAIDLYGDLLVSTFDGGISSMLVTHQGWLLYPERQRPGRVFD
jgi:hypothetical protein